MGVVLLNERVRYELPGHHVELSQAAWDWVQRGNQRLIEGDIYGAVASYRQASAIEPNDVLVAGNVMGALDLIVDDPLIYSQERRSFDERFCLPLTRKARPHTNDRSSERKLRVGYLSADFYAHSAANSFMPIVNHHDRRRIETYLYSTRSHGDVYTESFRANATVFQDASAWTDHDLAERIRRDKIDVLVDLSGYTHGSRLLALAEKPAPIQMTGWGYGVGTGLACMDYLISDGIAIPPSHEKLYREKILRLPCMLAYQPMQPGPPIGPPPVERNGFITFGYLGRPQKLSDATLRAWAEIMRRVPGSHLYLKHPGFVAMPSAMRVMNVLVSLGIDPGCVSFELKSSRYEHNAAYNKIDIALDSWPESGGATTLDACSMGVPTVTFLGRMVQHRTASAIVAHAGITDLIDSVESYVARAVMWANDRRFLREVRTEMPAQFLRSDVCQPAIYTQAFEDELRGAWRAWCRSARDGRHAL